MSCSLLKKASNSISSAVNEKNFTESNFIESVSPLVVIEGFTNEDANSILSDDVKFNEAYSNFRETDFKQMLFSSLYNTTDDVDENGDFEFEDDQMVFPASLKENFPIVLTINGSYDSDAELFLTANFDNELKSIFRKIVEHKLIDRQDAINKQGKDSPESVSDADLSERLNLSYDTEINKRLEKQSNKTNIYSKFKVMDREAFIDTFFGSAPNIYINKFDPHVKVIMRNALFNDVIPADETRTEFNDIDENVNNNVESILDYFINKYNLPIDKSRVIGESDSSRLNRLGSDIDKALSLKFAKDVGSNFSAFSLLDPTIKELNYYMDLVFIKNFNTVISNNSGFIGITENDDGELTYMLNDVIENKRTNPNDDKNGTDQNTEFIKSVIKSIQKMVPVEKFTDVELGEMLPIELYHEYESLGTSEQSYVDFLKQNKDISYVTDIDSDSGFLTYNEYNMASISNDLIKLDGTVEDVAQFLRDKKDTIGLSMFNSLFSDEPITFYNNTTGRLEKQYSLLHILKKIVEVNDNDDGTYDASFPVNPLIQQVFTAVIRDFKSRGQRIKIDQNGIIHYSMDSFADVRAIGKLNGAFTENIDSTVLDPDLRGKVFLEKKIVDIDGENLERIYLIIKHDNGDVEIPLEGREDALTATVIESLSSLVNVDVDATNENFNKVGDSYVLSSNARNKILETLNFPDYLKGALNKGTNSVTIEGEPNLDITGFIVNLATVVALNDSYSDKGYNTNSSKVIAKQYLGIDSELITTLDNTKRYTQLPIDPYTILWKQRNSIVSEQVKINGVDGSSQITTPGGGRTAKISPRSNENFSKFVTKAQQEENNLGFANNAIVNREFNFDSVVFKSGVDDYASKTTVSTSRMTEHDKVKINNEKYFFNNAINDNKFVIQLYASDRSQPLLHVFNRGSIDAKYTPIPLTEKGELDTQLLRNKLIDVKRKSLSDAQNLVMKTYKDVFVRSNSDLKSRMRTAFPNMLNNEIDKKIARIELALNKLDSEETHNKMRGLNDIIIYYGLTYEFLNLIEEIPQGLYYSNNGLVTDAFITDLDLWNDKLSTATKIARDDNGNIIYEVEEDGYEVPVIELAYDSDSVITLNSFINDMFSKRKSYIEGHLKYKKVTNKTKKDLNKYINKNYPDHKALTDEESMRLIDKAQHYWFLIFDELANPIRTGDIYKFIKNEKTIEDIRVDMNGKSGNPMIRAYIDSRSSALATRSKRDSILTSMGPTPVSTRDNTLPFAKTTEQDYTFYDNEVTINTFGSMKDSKEVTNDGAAFITMIAQKMRSVSSAEKFSYTSDRAIIKDVNYINDIAKRNSTTDKKATHPLMSLNAMNDVQYDIMRRLHENTLFNSDGSPTMVLVPSVTINESMLNNKGNNTSTKSEVVVSIDWSRSTYVEFSNMQQVLDYLGGTLNKNLDDNYVKILLMAENFDIRDKYPATISFEHTRKTGSNVTNSTDNLYNPNGKIYPQTIDITGNISILDLNKDPNEAHQVTMSMQQMYASLTGMGSREQGVDIFKAVSTMYNVNYIKKNFELQDTINNILVNPEDYLLSDFEKKNSEDILKNIDIIYRAVSSHIESNLDSVESFKLLEEQMTSEIEKESLMLVFKSSILDIIKETMNTQSNSDAVKFALNENPIIDGTINSMYTSMVRTLASKTLTIKINGTDNVATQNNDTVRVYENENGEVITKSRYNFMAEKVNIDKTGFLKENLTSEIDSKVENANVILVNNSFENNRFQFNLINNKAAILKSFEENGSFHIDQDYIIIDVDRLSPTETDSIGDIVNELMHKYSSTKKVIIFDSSDPKKNEGNELFFDDADLILSENNDIINSSEYSDITVSLGIDKLTESFMHFLDSKMLIEFSC